MKRLYLLLFVLLACLLMAAQWETIEPMSVARSDAMVALDDEGTLYVFGGTNLSDYLTSSESYQPDVGWAALADLPEPFSQGNAACYEQNIYIPGGVANGTIVDTMLIYDTAADSWDTGVSPPAERYGYSLDVLGEYLYALGGADTLDESQSNCWQYDPAGASWTAMESMNSARRYHGSAALEGKLYVFGGIDDSAPTPQAKVEGEVYDPVADEWSAIADMPVTFWGGSSGVVDGVIWACHGMQNDQPSATCMSYDPTEDEWTIENPAAEERYRVGSASSPLYAVGGTQIGLQGAEAVVVVERLISAEVDDDTVDDDTVDDDTVDDDDDNDTVDDDDSIQPDDDSADDDAVADDDDDDNACGC